MDIMDMEAKRKELFAAITRQDAVTVKKLVKANKELISSCDEDGYYPIHICAKHGTYEIMDILICFGSDINQRTNSNDTPSILSARLGNISCLLTLIMKGADSLLYNHCMQDALDVLAQEYDKIKDYNTKGSKLTYILDVEDRPHLAVECIKEDGSISIFVSDFK